MKKITSFLIALITALSLITPVYANEITQNYCSIGDNYALLIDYAEVLPDEEEQNLLSRMVLVADKYKMNVGFITTNELEGVTDIADVIEYGDGYIDEFFPENTNSTLFVLNNANYLNWLSVSGAFETNISHYDSSNIYMNIANAIISEDFVGTIDIYCESVSSYADALIEQGLFDAVPEQTENSQTTEPESETQSGSTDILDSFDTSLWGSGINTEIINGNTALLHDLDNSLSENAERNAMGYLVKAVEETGFSICVVITDNIGSDKSDRQVVDYADVYYEDYCGMNTDGILLLINNDTKYDWISTSGNCIDMFYDAIDPIFDNIYDYIVDGNLEKAIYRFSESVIYYSNQDYAHYSDYGDDYNGPSDSWGDYGSYDDYDVDISFALDGLIGITFFAGIVITITLIIFFSVIKSNYSLNKNKTVAPYQLKNSLSFSQISDTYLRTYTTRTRVSSSSSGSHRSGGGRSHRSSGGGRHGGGGRRR